MSTPMAKVSIAKSTLMSPRANRISTISFTMGRRPPWCIPMFCELQKLAGAHYLRQSAAGRTPVDELVDRALLGCVLCEVDPGCKVRKVLDVPLGKNINTTVGSRSCFCRKRTGLVQLSPLCCPRATAAHDRLGPCLPPCRPSCSASPLPSGARSC